MKILLYRETATFMQKTLFLLMLTAFTSTLYGQFRGEYKKNSLGLDLIPIAQNMAHSDSLIPYGVTYRRFIAPNHAVRLRVDGGYKNDVTYYSESKFHLEAQERKYVLGVALGYQYLVPMYSWTGFSFSIDFLAQEEKRKASKDDYTATQRIETTHNTDILRLAVAPAVGVYLRWQGVADVSFDISPRYTYKRTKADFFGYRYDKYTGVEQSAFWTFYPVNAVQAISPFCTLSLLFNF